MKSLIKIFFLVVWTSISFAQGSVYTRYGVGDLVYNYSARRFGMGNLGIAVSDKDFISGVNPAGWNSIGLTRMEASVAFGSKIIGDANDSYFFKNTLFKGITFAVPIQRDYGITFSFGVLPYSRVDYDVEIPVKSSNVGEFTQALTGKGGLSKIYLGGSYRLPFGFSLGASFDYYFGDIVYSSTLIFPDTSSFKTVGYVMKKSSLGMGATFGMLSPDISKFLGASKIKNLRVGAVFSLTTKLNTDTTISTNNLVGSNQIANGLAETKLPSRMGLGVSFVYSNNYLFTFDFLTQNWAEYEFANKTESYLGQAFKFSWGMEYFREISEFSSFWEQIRYRFGLSYEKTPFTVLGNDVFKSSISAGISFPMGVYNSIDIGIAGGIMGKKGNKTLEEKFLEARIALSFGERWFIRKNR